MSMPIQVRMFRLDSTQSNPDDPPSQWRELSGKRGTKGIVNK
jgi:hypothetical protein